MTVSQNYFRTSILPNDDTNDPNGNLNGNSHFINKINLYFTNSVVYYTVKLYFKINIWGLCMLSQIKLADGE